MGMLQVLLCSVLLCGLSLGRKITVDLRVETRAAVNTIDELFTCVTLDWWPSSKCDYGNCPWGQNSALNIDLQSVVLRKALQAFQGQYLLRIGGSLSDFVVYKVPDSPSSISSKRYCSQPDFSAPTLHTKIGYEFMSGCLEMERWNALHSFCAATRCNLIFGLNALYGRTPPVPCPESTICRKPSPPSCCTSWSGHWDPANAEALLRYSYKRGHNIYGLELGNELVGKKGIQAHVNVDDYLEDWRRFNRLLDAVYGPKDGAGEGGEGVGRGKKEEEGKGEGGKGVAKGIKRPLTIGPDTSWMSDWVSVWLLKIGLEDESAALEPDMVSHHLYSMGAGINENAWQVALNVTVMNTVVALGKDVHATVRKASPRSRILVGEAGGAYNSGANNVTNTFNSGFWFLDQLGVFAANGHGAYCRQTLAGGFYSLLDSKTLLPNPDYYSLLAWTKLMGRRSLHVFAIPTKQPLVLRSYAHCLSTRSPLYKPGAIVVLLINTSNATHVKVNLETEGKSDLASTRRQDFHFTSACPGTLRQILACRSVLLNGQPLEVTPDTLDFGAGIVGLQRDAAPLVLTPLSYAFIAFPEARAEACDDAPG